MNASVPMVTAGHGYVGQGACLIIGVIVNL